jgi:hypothetical protein
MKGEVLENRIDDEDICIMEIVARCPKKIREEGERKMREKNKKNASK